MTRNRGTGCHRAANRCDAAFRQRRCRHSYTGELLWQSLFHATVWESSSCKRYCGAFGSTRWRRSASRRFSPQSTAGRKAERRSGPVRRRFSFGRHGRGRGSRARRTATALPYPCAVTRWQSRSGTPRPQMQDKTPSRPGIGPCHCAARAEPPA